MSDGLICQKCQKPSDLGNLCRACYREWRAGLYADIPEWQREITQLSKALNLIPKEQRVAIAETLLRKPEAGPVSASYRHLVETGRHVLTGPFAESLVGKCQEISNRARFKDSAGSPKHKEGMDD